MKANIKNVKKHLGSIFLHAKSIKIKIDKDTKFGFRSIIKISAPQKRVLVASKSSSDPSKSLELASNAIIRQIHKVQTKWKRKPRLSALKCA